jgi:hypothetical protein
MVAQTKLDSRQSPKKFLDPKSEEIKLVLQIGPAISIDLAFLNPDPLWQLTK